MWQVDENKNKLKQWRSHDFLKGGGDKKYY